MKSFEISIKGAKTVAANIKKINDIAAYRTINTLQARGMKSVSREITKNYPIKQKDVKDATTVKKAYPGQLFATWRVNGYRPVLANAKQLKKGGISYKKFGKVNAKSTEPIKGGSKAFIIMGRNSGKELPVFRKAGVKTWLVKPKQGQGGKRGPVTVLRGHSIPYLFKRVEWDKIVRDVWRREWQAEYHRQLEKAKY